MKHILSKDKISLKQPPLNQEFLHSWFQILAAVIIFAYVYSFSEWIFFITQPSYFAGSPNLFLKVSIFLFSGLIIGGLFAVGIIFLFLLYLLIPSLRVRSWLHFLGKLLLSFLLACLLLLLVDNFTYTLFNFGIVNSSGLTRGIYALLFIGIIWLVYGWISPFVRPTSQAEYRKKRKWFFIAMGLFFLSLLSVLSTNIKGQPSEFQGTAAALDKPHILLIGSDGLDAAHLSAYGYSRDTTPNLKALAAEALVAENAFSNSTSSAASVTSILTGKLPETTRVMLPPDILTGEDALEHLPGILKSEGYTSIEIGIPHYIDAYTMNMQRGFDIVNNRSIDNYPILYEGWKIGGDYPFYFTTITIERISSRLKHILFIKTMDNPYQEVTTGLGVGMTDRDRTDQILSYLEAESYPLFIHVHYDSTHGPWFFPTEKYYAKSAEQITPGDIDYYDDAIREFDRYLGEIMHKLEEMGVKDNTLIVIYSDHAQNKSVGRLPWMIRFPEGRYAGKIQNNVQNLDIAPTILDYMKLPIPAWMEGKSMLSENPDPYRPIFITSLSIDQLIPDSLWVTLDTAKIKPPFYQFGMERMVVCNQYYEVNLVDLTWSEGAIPQHTEPCDPAALPTLEEGQEMIINHLAGHGFDVSSIVK